MSVPSAREKAESIRYARILQSSLVTRVPQWLVPWWVSSKLPVCPKTLKPRLTRDLWLHAMAVTCLRYCDTAGLDLTKLQVTVGVDSAETRFRERIFSFSWMRSGQTEGEEMLIAVLPVALRHLVPVTPCGPVPQHRLSMVAVQPSPSALSRLADLLLHFSE